MDWETAWRWARWPIEWVVAMRDLPKLRRDVEELKRLVPNGCYCDLCGRVLTVTAADDLPARNNGGFGGRRRSLRCDTPGCGFKPVTRNFPTGP